MSTNVQEMWSCVVGWDGGIEDDPDADQFRATRLEEKMSTPKKVSDM